MRIERIGLDEWGTALPNAGFEVFHLPDAISVLADHADADCRLYAARKGEETVGLFPIFILERRVGRAVTSPPPGLSVPRLGPIVMPNSPKQHKYEAINNELIDGVLEDVAVEDSRALCRVLTPLAYDDPRPFQWHDLSVTPRFTYVIDLSSHDTMDSLMSEFSRSLRNDMRQRDETDVTISDERREGALRVQADLAERYREQDETLPASRQYVADIVDNLPDRYRAYVARDETGAYLGGILVLYSNDLAYFWLGGVRNSHDGVSVNTLIHRRILEDLFTDPDLSSVEGYDLFGANTERLCEYKAKFGGQLQPYFVAESDSFGMTAAKTAYRLFSGSLSKS